MSYSITINFEMSGAATPLLPQDYILADATNPTSIEEGQSATLKFKADGMYFKLKARKGASATGATLTWSCPSPNTNCEITLSNPTDNVIITIVAVVENAPQIVSKPFLYKTTAPVDTRLVLTKKEMREANDNYLPDTYFALCKDDGHFYLYNKSNDLNAETGKFTIITDILKTDFDNFDGGEII